MLEEKGYMVDVVDCQTSQPTQQQLHDKFASLNPDIIGVTSATLTYLPALDILELPKKPCQTLSTLIGGPHVTVRDQQVFTESQDVDVVVRSEGEQTMLELAALVSEGNLKGLSEVLGITFRRNGQVYRNPDRPFMIDIDKLPFPAHKHFDVSKYKIMGKTYLPIITRQRLPLPMHFLRWLSHVRTRFQRQKPK